MSPASTAIDNFREQTLNYTHSSPASTAISRVHMQTDFKCERSSAARDRQPINKQEFKSNRLLHHPLANGQLPRIEYSRNTQIQPIKFEYSPMPKWAPGGRIVPWRHLANVDI
jgi:hypothetical protein